MYVIKRINRPDRKNHYINGFGTGSWTWVSLDLADKFDSITKLLEAALTNTQFIGPLVNEYVIQKIEPVKDFVVVQEIGS